MIEIVGYNVRDVYCRKRVVSSRSPYKMHTAENIMLAVAALIRCVLQKTLC